MTVDTITCNTGPTVGKLDSCDPGKRVNPFSTVFWRRENPRAKLQAEPDISREIETKRNAPILAAGIVVYAFSLIVPHEKVAWESRPVFQP